MRVGIIQMKNIIIQILISAILKSGRFGLFADGNVVSVIVTSLDCRRFGILAATRAYEKPLIEVVHHVAGLGHLRRRNGRLLFSTRCRNIGLRLLALLVLVLALLLLVELFRHLVDGALVVLGVLQIAFRQNAVTRRRSVTRQRQVLFIDLVCIAANTHIRAVAVEGVNPGIDDPAALSTAAVRIIIMPATAAATIAMAVMSSAATAATGMPRVLVIMSHFTLLFDFKVLT